MENIFEWLRYHKKLDLLLFVLFFIVIPTAPFIQSPIGILSKDDAIIFLSYYGTIIAGLSGGALTLFGVWWTIKDQEQKRKADLAMQYKPILIQKSYSDKECILSLFLGNINHLKMDKEELSDTLSFEIILENIGRAEALNISLEKIDFFANDKTFFLTDFIKVSKIISEFPPGYSLRLNTIIEIDYNLLESLQVVSVTNNASINFTISYNDIYGNHKRKKMAMHIKNIQYSTEFNYYCIHPNCCSFESVELDVDIK